jgi:hypothetical protein
MGLAALTALNTNSSRTASQEERERKKERKKEREKERLALTINQGHDANLAQTNKLSSWGHFQHRSTFTYC